MSTHHTHTIAVSVGTRPPIEAIIYHQPEPDEPNDSGFTLLHGDAPDDPGDLADNDERLRTVCINCLLDENPGIGRGLDLARQHGSADLDPDTGWVAG